MPLFPSHSSLFVFTLCLFLCLPVSIGLAECHSDLDKAPVSVLLPHFPLSALVHCMLFFVLWVRVTSLTHFNQPNWYSYFAIDEAITWLVCCAPWSLNGEGRLPWEKKKLWPGFFFCVCAACSRCQHYCSRTRAPAGCGAGSSVGMTERLWSRKASLGSTPSFGLITTYLWC